MTNHPAKVKERVLAMVQKAQVSALDLEEELNNYKIQARELQLENTDLRNELNAFDPSFFEEIEDLKHEHFQLTKRCSEYEETIRDLRGRG